MVWSDLIGHVRSTPIRLADIQDMIYRCWDTLVTVAVILSLLQDCAHKPGCQEELNASCGMAGVKACCFVLIPLSLFVLYLCPRILLWTGRQYISKPEDMPTCYQETKMAFK